MSTISQHQSDHIQIAGAIPSYEFINGWPFGNHQLLVTNKKGMEYRACKAGVGHISGITLQGQTLYAKSMAIYRKLRTEEPKTFGAFDIMWGRPSSVNGVSK